MVSECSGVLVFGVSGVRVKSKLQPNSKVVLCDGYAEHYGARMQLCFSTMLPTPCQVEMLQQIDGIGSASEGPLPHVTQLGIGRPSPCLLLHA